MKPIIFKGTSLDDIRSFNADIRRQAGFQLDKVQQGLTPNDWKPMPSIGKGVRESVSETTRALIALSM